MPLLIPIAIAALLGGGVGLWYGAKIQDSLFMALLFALAIWAYKDGKSKG